MSSKQITKTATVLRIWLNAVLDIAVLLKKLKKYMTICRVSKYFSFNCGPKWSAVVHYEGYGIGIRHEYSHIRIMLLFWHVFINA